MHLLSIGLNHTTAPIDLRERLAFNEDSVRALFASLDYCAGLRPEHSPVHTGLAQAAERMVILSTCNRTEIYNVSDQPDFAPLEIFLSDASRIPLNQLGPHLYRFSGLGVARHLFRVAAGLDSQVLGESQILGQVSKAFDLARQAGTAAPLLSRLFQAAIHAGKRVHAETVIGRNPASVASLAASIAERSVVELAKAQVVILGAGEMARLALQSLRKRGAKHILLVNRSLERAEALSARWEASPAPLEALENALAGADILIASTGAATPILSREMVEAAMRQRPGRPLLLVDIAVPRNITPETAEIPNVSLYDIDHLNARFEQSLAERLAEAPRVEAILAQEEDKFIEYLNSLSILPLIAGMHQQAEEIRQAELAKTLRHLPGLDETERARIEALTHALVSKLLETPTKRLRSEATCPQGPKYAAVARSLFDLPGERGLCQFSGASCPVDKTLSADYTDCAHFKKSV